MSVWHADMEIMEANKAEHSVKGDLPVQLGPDTPRDMEHLPSTRTGSSVANVSVGLLVE